MKKILQKAALVCAMGFMLTSFTPLSQAALAEGGDLVLANVTVIAETFGDGQKPSAAALLYSLSVDPASVSVEDFQVEGKTITKAYTNSEAAKAVDGSSGNYVILEFANENTSSATAGGGGGGTRPAGDTGERPAGGTGGQADGGLMINEDAPVDLSISLQQVGEVASEGGAVCAASNVAIAYSEPIQLIAQDFTQYEYTDPATGYTIPYNLFLPKDYDASKSYPLVFFVADSGANNNLTTTPLTQGNGATIWASPEEQAKHECIVLAPQYTTDLLNQIGALTEDTNQWSEGLTLVSNLLFSIIDEYSVDLSRIYGTGQSQGCMSNIAISDRYPDLFAAQFLVAGQWNVEEMSVMKDDNLWITVCEGDSKAYPGMDAATANWEALGAKVARSDMWDSTLAPEAFDALVDAMQAQGSNINYTVFAGGSHMYTWSVAYGIEGIRDWLFAQARE